MEPSNTSYGQNTSTAVHSSNDIIWSGPDISCISLCKGDKITEVMSKIATKLCELQSELDLSDLDLNCIYNYCNSCPDPEKSVINVFRLLIDAFCELKDKVDSISGDSEGSGSFLDVNLKCLAVFNGAQEILNQDTHKEIIQSIIDEVCVHRSQIAQLNSELDSIQSQLDSLPPPESFSLPLISSNCLFLGSRALDQAFAALDLAFCSLRSSVGSVADINSNISKQPTNTVLGIDITSASGFIQSPSNMAQSFGNMWVSVNNLLGRVKSIEDNCCKVDCSSVELGFSVTLVDDRSVAVLRFNFGTGTSIPEGFIDCGSVITVTDSIGNSVRSLVSLSNNVELEVDLSGLDLFSDFVFNLDSCLSNGGLQCKKCVTKTIKFQDTCSFCEISNTGTTGQVVIIYEDTINSGA